MKHEIIIQIDTDTGTAFDDAPELIRCRDCDWWTKQNASLQGRCARHGMYPTGEWYCAGAERREDG